MTAAKLVFQPIPQSCYNTEPRMAKRHWKARRKLRKREHVIAEMSVNFLERKVLSH